MSGATTSSSTTTTVGGSSSTTDDGESEHVRLAAGVQPAEELLLNASEQQLQPPRRRPWVTVLVAGLSTACWLIMATGMPFYNTLTFDSYLPPHSGAGSALTPTLVEMIGASVLLVSAEMLRFLLCGRGKAPPPRGGSRPWLFGPPLVPKLLYVGVPALMYAGVMGTTNTSLKVTSVNLHVILRATSIVWVVLFALLFQRECPTVIAVICCCGLVAGTVLSSVSFHSSFTGDTVGPILLTLLSAVFQAGLIVSTRLALTARNGALFGGGGADEPFLPLQAVALKMCLATVFLAPIAVGLDWQGWVALVHAPPPALGLVLGGVFITALFASFQILLQQVAGAITVGIVTMCVLIPQVLLSLIIEHPPMDALHIAGYVVNPVVATAYAAERVYLLFASRKR